ncbi:hypothetical protein FB382_004190 [Nocardioides ginsengisegetis]|uniref:4-vinyl reductase 4VR domain-containing protein n=1 Tax=Nocardioides ginsengisegetis TaxID=661491 RepID=A0A7W3PBI0_9ACTN|nr:heme NO-binding domain-containing protein [Nocardioides ginsengisegetis]MBA8805845.1 hypothetical protein [Nocardioides ginsengisegetis]
MKGIIFNLFEELVVGRGGERVWDQLLTDADLTGGYTSLGTYRDAELATLVGAFAEDQDSTGAEVQRAFGRHAIVALAERYPQFFEPHAHTVDFLLTLNDVIHTEVRKLHAEANPPTFEFERSGPSTLRIGYGSDRRMCAFAEGMIAGAAEHFGEDVSITQPRCQQDGAADCVLVCEFRARA